MADRELARKNGQSSAAIRATELIGIELGMFVTRTVLNPVASNICASTGTFRQQSGQAGVRRTASTASSFIRPATSGAYFSRHSRLSIW